MLRTLAVAVMALAPGRCPPAQPPPPDFDGDGRPDSTELSFSGGAHCCYKVSVTLSSTGKVHAFPFEMDGGGPGPYRTFSVGDFDGDGLDDLRLEIQTYNGEPDRIPRRWTRRYGIRSNNILLSFVGGRPRARDWP